VATITSYKCPNCGANIPFDANEGTLKCQHCDTVFSVEDLNNYNVEQEIKADSYNWEKDNTQTVDVEGKLTYVCPSCGGQVIADENTAATSCPYCGTPIVVGEKVSGMLKPDMIIPFKLDMQAAKDAYLNYLKKKTFLPNDFKINNIIDKLNGIYVPYWLFDASVDGQARFRTTRHRSYTTGDYHVTETSHYLVYRDGQARFEKVPVDASIKLEDGLLDALEPFDYSKTVDFNSAYLSSYLADKYDQDQNQSINKANMRIKNSMLQILANSVVGYDSVLPEASSVQFHDGKAHYALLPIYLFTTKYNGKVYQFAMNGQTGKFAGDLPMDKGKAFKYCGLIFIISFVVIFGLCMLKGGI